jgi:chemotaxis signal transduction protein
LAAGKEQEFVEGVARQGERLVTLIDLQALVS